MIAAVNARSGAFDTEVVNGIRSTSSSIQAANTADAAPGDIVAECAVVEVGGNCIINAYATAVRAVLLRGDLNVR